jgi:hypothetical protein
MSEHGTEIRCPHCNEPLQAFRLPDASTWDAPVHRACFNDECPYFREGWQWMQERYAVNASYRYRVTDAEGARPAPLAVWSRSALRDLIVSEEERESNR